MKSSNFDWNPVFLSERESAQDLQKLRNQPGLQIFDTLDIQLADLVKTQAPRQRLVDAEIAELVRKKKSAAGPALGHWVYFPWRNQLVHLLNETDFIVLRTNRNAYKITPDEQNQLAKKKIGVVGLSVGSVAALALAIERSFGEIRLCDYDTLDLSNLNRIPYGVASLGIPKAVLAARMLFEIDPYLNIKIFEAGLTKENLQEFFQKDGNLDLVIDECDSIDVKILIRHKARQLRIPTVMETSDRGLLDIERFDLEPERPLFHGRVGDPDPEQFASLSTEEKIPFILKIAGIETSSVRAKASLLEIEQSIKTWPQLGSAIFHGAAAVAESARRILLGEDIPSGRHHIDIEEFISRKPFAATEMGLSEDYIKNYQQQKSIDFEVAKQQSLNFKASRDVELNASQCFCFLSQAEMAPSGGNNRPWIVVPNQGSLFLWKRTLKEDVLSPGGRSTLIGLGACFENLRLAALSMGLEGTFEMTSHLQLGSELQSIGRFDLTKSAQPADPNEKRLFEGIKLRKTNRRFPREHRSIPLELKTGIDSYLKAGFRTHWLTAPEQLKKMAALIGQADRIRLMGAQSHQEFMAELRFSPQEFAKTGDGLDLKTFELSAADLSGLAICRSWPVVESLKKWNLGQGLTKFSARLVEASSAVVLISMSEQDSAENWFEAGQTIQRMWIESALQKWAFQPMTALIYLMNRVKAGGQGLDPWQISEIEKLTPQLQEVANLDPAAQRVFLFRLAPV